MMLKRMYTIMMHGIFLLFLSSDLQAQKKDNLALTKEFIEVCNVYKHLPLYLDMELQNSTNFISDEQDTSFIRASFYIQPGASYTRFGEMELLINDSLSLFVSDRLQQMILSGNDKPVAERMRAMVNTPLGNTGATVIAEKFKSEKTISNGRAIIELTDRSLLYGTMLPKESISLEYDAASKVPLRVTTMKRTLLHLDESDYKVLSSEPAMVNKLLTIDSDKHYVIKEQTATYIYKTIDHGNAKIPALVTDRIVRNSEGSFAPAKSYEDYRLITN